VSLITQAFVVEKFGVRLNSKQLAEVLGVTVPSLHNAISAETCPVKTYVSMGKRWADYRDVAAYLDQCRQTA
jgi:hypothetical protein